MDSQLKNNLYLLAGLGNPGSKYASTRHNVGFMVIDRLAETFSISLNREDFGSIWGRGAISSRSVILAKPQNFMNRSGPPIQRLMHYYRIRCEDMLVIHDDIDLAFERLKIKMKGGHGGHKGLKSLIDAVGTGDFNRLRIGVGRPDHGAGVADYVLDRFSSEENAALAPLLDRARDAAVTFLCDGAKESMNRFNRKK